MTDSSIVRIAVACEDQAQRAVVTSLARQVVLDAARHRLADWVESYLDQQMRFYGLDCNDARRNTCVTTRFIALPMISKS